MTSSKERCTMRAPPFGSSRSSSSSRSYSGMFFSSCILILPLRERISATSAHRMPTSKARIAIRISSSINPIDEYALFYFLHGREFSSFLDVYSYDSRTARFVHGNPQQLICHFHGQLVVGNKNKLH